MVSPLWSGAPTTLFARCGPTRLPRMVGCHNLDTRGTVNKLMPTFRNPPWIRALGPKIAPDRTKPQEIENHGERYNQQLLAYRWQNPAQEEPIVNSVHVNEGQKTPDDRHQGITVMCHSVVKNNCQHDFSWSVPTLFGWIFSPNVPTASSAAD